MSLTSPWTNTRKNSVKMTKDEEETTRRLMPQKIEEWRKAGLILKMVPVNDTPTKEDLKKWKAPEHSFCYSGLHW